MRAVVLDGFGGPEILALGEVPTPQVEPGQVRLKVAAAGVNRADVLQRRGFYPPPKGITDILGLEVAGTIDQVAHDVTGWQAGDPAVALLAGGGYAEYVTVPAGQCAAPPEGVGLVKAAALMEVAATVVSNFDHVALAKGESVLIHGGAGGIGSLAIPYAAALGARVFTTVGTDAKAEYVHKLGANVIFNYHQDWAAALAQETGGQGVDVILDIMGAKYLESNLKSLARGGRLCVIGLQGGVKGTLDLNRLLSKAATVTATSLRFRPTADKASIVSQVTARVWPLVTQGAIPVPPVTVFPFDQVVKAHQQLEAGNNMGKIVLSL